MSTRLPKPISALCACQWKPLWLLTTTVCVVTIVERHVPDSSSYASKP